MDDIGIYDTKYFSTLPRPLSKPLKRYRLDSEDNFAILKDGISEIFREAVFPEIEKRFSGSYDIAFTLTDDKEISVLEGFLTALPYNDHKGIIALVGGVYKGPNAWQRLCGKKANLAEYDVDYFASGYEGMQYIYASDELQKPENIALLDFKQYHGIITKQGSYRTIKAADILREQREMTQNLSDHLYNIANAIYFEDYKLVFNPR